MGLFVRNRFRFSIFRVCECRLCERLGIIAPVFEIVADKFVVVLVRFAERAEPLADWSHQ